MLLLCVEIKHRIVKDDCTYSYVHQGWVLEPSKLCIECINIFFGEANDTLNVSQLQKKPNTMSKKVLY